MEGIWKEGYVIVYIDEIYNLIGVGWMGDGLMDVFNMFKFYLEGGEIWFIGFIIYEEFNCYFLCSRGLVWCF